METTKEWPYFWNLDFTPAEFTDSQGNKCFNEGMFIINSAAYREFQEWLDDETVGTF